MPKILHNGANASLCTVTEQRTHVSLVQIKGETLFSNFLLVLDSHRELNNQIMEAEAWHSLGVAQQARGEHAAAVRHHRAELELAHRLGLTHLQVCIPI